MKNIPVNLLGAVLVIINAHIIFAGSDVRAVQSQFNRCVSVIKRAEHSLRRCEQQYASQRRSFQKLSSEQKEPAQDELISLENRLEQMKNRFDALHGQADLIREDLGNIKGPTCPTCVESRVNFYCRNGENLQAQTEEFLRRVSALEKRIRSKNKEQPDCFRNELEDLNRHYTSLDSLYNYAIEICAENKDNAIIVLLEQARANILRFDSLSAISHERTSAAQALEISDYLIQQVLQRCKNR